MDNNIVLTLCIPTNGAVGWVRNTVEGIYLQNCDESLFEVIVVDNGVDSSLGDIISTYNHQNLSYYKTDVEGFYNLIVALKYGKGTFIKVLNHRSILQPHSLGRMIEVIQRYERERPVLFFSNSCLGRQEFYECSDMEHFINVASFWITWSEGIGIWNEEKCLLDTIDYDEMFPNTSLLLNNHKEKRYIIWNGRYERQQDGAGKGGYNFFKVFAVGFLDILNDLRRQSRISIKTFNSVRYSLFRNYLISYYYQLVVKTNDRSFDLSGIKENMSVYYPRYYYWWMILHSHIVLRFKSVLCK